MRSDCPGTVGGAGGSGVHNRVVDDALMYAQCLQTSHPANPVRPVALSYGGDLKVATHSYPHHRKACQGCRQPLLRRIAPKKTSSRMRPVPVSPAVEDVHGRRCAVVDGVVLM
jgi:hypothetical protein